MLIQFMRRNSNEWNGIDSTLEERMRLVGGKIRRVDVKDARTGCLNYLEGLSGESVKVKEIQQGRVELPRNVSIPGFKGSECDCLI